MRIMHILTDSNIGGAGRLLINYLHNFDRTQFEIAVVLPRDAALKPLVEAEGYPVLEMDNGRDKSFDMAAVKELKKMIREWKPDIVHTHSSFSGKLAAWLCGVPRRFYTRHCAFEPPKRLTTFPGKQINGWINTTLATDIVAVAQAAKDNLTDTGIRGDKVTVIINGVEPMRETDAAEKTALRQSLGIGEDTFVCGISARLEEYKGHKYLLESAKQVCDAHPDTVFLLMGEGSCREALEEQTKSLGIADKVYFTGFLDDVAPYYGIMDVNLNCSIGTETSSLALSEGMSVGVPAIATTFGGNPYMVTDGWNGFLVPERDPAAMAEKILDLIRDPALHGRLSDGAREAYRTKFTAAAMTRQLEKLYLA
ncbi:MAG: glycosyltransferase [Clostridia bacterium]|nr:glycosyltransferase [Clostridia bacterium]